MTPGFMLRSLLPAALSCGCLMAAQANAQMLPQISAGAVGRSIDASSVLSNGSATMSGTLYGGEGVFAWRGFTLRLGYAEGTVGIGDSEIGSGANSGGGVVGGILAGIFGQPGGSPTTPGEFKMAEGHFLLGWNVIDGLELGAGVQGRARIMDSESERLLLVLGRARYEAPIVTPYIKGFVEGWHSITGRATAPQEKGTGRGGSAGVLAEVGPLGVRMSYGVDQARYSDDIRRETVQGISVVVGYIVR